MTFFSQWLRNLAGLGNAGAVANAARSCNERRATEQQLDAALRRLSAARPGDKSLVRPAGDLRRPA